MQTSNPTPTTAAAGDLPRGVLFVLIGSASYGLLSTFVKLAYRQGFTTAEVTSSQFLWGALALTLMARVFARTQPGPTAVEKRALMWAGTSTGFTSVLYYIAVNYIPASIAVVLLMQSIWLGVLFESLVRRQRPTWDKVAAVLLVLLGTVLATNTLEATATATLDLRGLLFGFLSAISYCGTLVATGNVAAHRSPIHRSQYMLYGGAIVVFAFALLTQIGPHYLRLHLLSPDFTHDRPFDLSLLFTYGLFVAIFGTILPPILLNKGFPITGVGLGSIISSVELPFAAMVAYLLLGERIAPVQLLGIVVILVSVFVLNYRLIVGSARAPGPAPRD